MASCMATSKVGDHEQGGRPRTEQVLNKFDKHACDIKAIYKVDGLCEHAFQKCCPANASQLSRLDRKGLYTSSLKVEVQC